MKDSDTLYEEVRTFMTAVVKMLLWLLSV